MEPYARLTNANGMLTKPDQVIMRRISDMASWYLDVDAARRLEAADDPVVYEMLEVAPPAVAGELAFCTTTMHPGMVGDEYFMTKGHFHVDLSCAEIYYAYSGHGVLLAETESGECRLVDMPQGAVVHVEPGWAHRTYNVGREPLVFLAVYPSVAGHDYGRIETHGFSHTVVRSEQGPVLTKNPRYAPQ